MENKKIWTMIYALSIVGIVGALLMSVYNLTFATNGVDMSDKVETMYRITNILCLVMIALLVGIIITNFFLKDKFFWLEIGFAVAIIIGVIVLLSLNEKTIATSAYIMVWFEVICNCLLIIISRLCAKFSNIKKTKEVKDEESN